MNNRGFILMKTRRQKSLKIKEAAQLIGRSTGWLSEMENGKASLPLSDAEFENILKAYGVTKDPKRFASWVAVKMRTEKVEDVSFDGAILKYLREKKGLSLKEVADKVQLTSSYISQMENGDKRITQTMRNRLLKIYGYSPGSYKNFTSNDKRGKSVPSIYKLEILLKHFDEDKIDKIFEFSQTLVG